MRVFHGPNGSGKSTIIKFVNDYEVNGRKINLGVYINADDIAVALKKKNFSFSNYQIHTTEKEFCEMALTSGLIGERFTQAQFLSSYRFHGNKILLTGKSGDALAQIIADFLRKKLLQLKKKFSFETVFSHVSKSDIMRQAKEDGYKVY